MSGPKHTAGPWRVFTTPDGRTLIGIGDAGGGGVTDCGFGTWRSGEEQLANARLIAAAPDLLEAGEALYLAIGNVSRDENPLETSAVIAAGIKWCAAIARAEGRSQ